MLQKVSKHKTWKSNTLQPEMENWEKESSKQNSKSVGLWEKPMTEEQPSWTHKGTHSRESHKKWDRTATGMQKFSQTKEKSKGLC